MECARCGKGMRIYVRSQATAGAFCLPCGVVHLGLQEELFDWGTNIYRAFDAGTPVHRTRNRPYPTKRRRGGGT